MASWCHSRPFVVLCSSLSLRGMPIILCCQCFVGVLNELRKPLVVQLQLLPASAISSSLLFIAGTFAPCSTGLHQDRLLFYTSLRDHDHEPLSIFCRKLATAAELLGIPKRFKQHRLYRTV